MAKPCERCRVNEKVSGRKLCADCIGKCLDCGGPSGMRSTGREAVVCKACRSERTSAWVKANPDRHRLNRIRWEQANPEKAAEMRRQYRARTKAEASVRSLRHSLKGYGLTVEQVEAMTEAQGGRCAICGGLPRGQGRLHVDHDHTHGHVRSLLCQPCNSGLGLAGEDPARLRRMADYLEAFSPLDS